MAPPRWIVWFSLLHQRMLIVSDLFTGTPPFSTCKNDLPDPGDRHSIREATSAAFAPISFPDHIRYLQTWARIHGSNKPGFRLGGIGTIVKSDLGIPDQATPIWASLHWRQQLEIHKIRCRRTANAELWPHQNRELLFR